MTLSEITLPIVDADAKALAIVFQESLAARLAAVWEEHGNTNLVPTPSRLSDGRWMLCADILTEIGPGGMLESMWANVDQATVLASVEVIPWADAVALLPPGDAE